MLFDEKSNLFMVLEVLIKVEVYRMFSIFKSLYKCSICKGALTKGTIDKTYQINNKVVEVRNIPVMICTRCDKTFIQNHTENNIMNYIKNTDHSVIDYSKLFAADTARKMF